MLIRRPFIAVLLSALVLPGLGQMLTGRLAQGVLMAGAAALWLPVALVKLGRDLAAVLPGLSALPAPTLADLQRALAPQASGWWWLATPLAAIWFWAVTDALLFAVRSGRRPEE